MLEALQDRADRVGAARARTEMISWLLAGAGLAVLGVFLDGVEVVRILSGSIAGVCWFVGSYLLFYAVLPERARTALDLRSRMPFPVRRRLLLAGIVVWLIAMIVLVQVAPNANSAPLGALNVALLLIAWRGFSLTPMERIELEAAYELEQEILAAQLEAQDAQPAPVDNRGPLARLLRRKPRR